MTRQWRIEFEETYYHILSRGNERASDYYEIKEGHCACARHLFFPAFTDGFQGADLNPVLGRELAILKQSPFLFAQK